LQEFLPIKAANTSIIAWYRRTAVWLSKMQEQKSLTLHLLSSLGDGSDVDTSVFGPKGGQYFDYVSQQPCRCLIMRLPTQKIIDGSLTLIP